MSPGYAYEVASGFVGGASRGDETTVVTAPLLSVVATRVQSPRWVRTMPGMGSPAEFSAVTPPQYMQLVCAHVVSAGRTICCTDMQAGTYYEEPLSEHHLSMQDTF